MWRAGSGQTSCESSSLAGGPRIIQTHGTSVEGEQKKPKIIIQRQDFLKQIDNQKDELMTK